MQQVHEIVGMVDIFVGCSLNYIYGPSMAEKQQQHQQQPIHEQNMKCSSSNKLCSGKLYGNATINTHSER